MHNASGTLCVCECHRQCNNGASAGEGPWEAVAAGVEAVEMTRHDRGLSVTFNNKSLKNSELKNGMVPAKEGYLC
ncbi:hypothetical protein [Cronobacter sakazakii]|uniref:hypothetical protein n=1 Tax=Cronobacter sakazakii TaxID=28141 RepID=UPI00131A20AE|nr:hypothetical protein [Cronobacter sakazakii]NCH13803.1 hypothetical protein [Cronobacter sakazakii]